jgi:hypothetical protein
MSTKRIIRDVSSETKYSIEFNIVFSIIGRVLSSRSAAPEVGGRQPWRAARTLVIREVVQLREQWDWDAMQRLDQCCRRLARIDAELVEWTLPPASREGKRVTAELLVTDSRHPLEQLASLLRRVADAVQRLTSPTADT